MYTFKDYDTGELIPFDSIDELILLTGTDYVKGQTSAYFVEMEGVKHRVYENFYDKVREDKGL